MKAGVHNTFFKIYKFNFHVINTPNTNKLMQKK